MIQLLREIMKLKLGPCCCDSVGICFRCFASVKFVGQEQDAQHEQWRQDRMERQRQVGNLVRQPSWSVFCAVSHDEAAFDQVVLCIVTQIYYRRATAHAADPGSGWWIFFLKVGMKAHWQVHFGRYQRCCAEPWLTP